MKLKLIVPAILLLAITGCKKDPPPPASTAAKFTLQNCLATTVQGNYIVATTLTASNTVTLSVNVTETGTYSVSTATINGYGFSKSGSFTTTGVQNLVLQGSGSPINMATSVFLLTAGNSSCSFPVTSSIPLPGNIDNDHMLFGNLSNASFLT